MSLLQWFLNMFGFDKPVYPPHPHPPDIPDEPPPVLPSVIVANPAPGVVHEINLLRVSQGIGILVIDQRCVILARRWALWMAENRSMVHGAFEQRAYEFFKTGRAWETIASGQMEPGQVIDSWEASHEHRVIMLEPMAAVVGAARARALDGTVFWCAVYAG